MNDGIGLRSPWMIYVLRTKALFAYDPDVTVAYDEDGCEMALYVNGDDKAEAIGRLMPSEMGYGNVTLKITVKPSNELVSEEGLFRRAFAGNPLFVGVDGGYGPVHDVSYALFVPEVVQIDEDDISEFGGYKTMTVADLAESVLGQTDVRVSTAVTDD